MHLYSQQRAFVKHPDRIVSWSNVGVMEVMYVHVPDITGRRPEKRVPASCAILRVEYDRIGATQACVYMAAQTMADGGRVDVYCASFGSSAVFCQRTLGVLSRRFTVSLVSGGTAYLCLSNGGSMDCVPLTPKCVRGMGTLGTSLLVVDLGSSKLTKEADAVLKYVLLHPTARVRIVGRDLPLDLRNLGTTLFNTF